MEMKNCINDLSESTKVSNNKNNITNSTLKNPSNIAFNDTLNKVINAQKNALDNSTKNSDVSNIDDKFSLYELQQEHNSLEEEADSAVSRLASEFGMNKMCMYLILKSLGIKPEDLLNPSMKKEILEKLSGFLLKGQSKEKLGELLDTFSSNN